MSVDDGQWEPASGKLDQDKRHLACLVTVHACNGLSRVQGKLSFQLVLRVEQRDLDTPLRKVWYTWKRLSDRGEGRFIVDW